MKFSKFLMMLSLVLYACSSDSVVFEEDIKETVSVNQDLPNIMLIIADDMGLDATPGYDIGTIKPYMPNLEGMINSGLRFNNVWSSPVCTPTRAGIITGKYGFRTNVTQVRDNLATSETSIQKFLDDKTANAYNHAIIGKWHLSNNSSHPGDLGINHFTGFLSGGVPSYFNWNITENAVTSSSLEYTTTKFTNLAIEWIDAQEKPWFLWLAYNAPHTPFHLPPNNLHHQGFLPDDEASISRNPLPYYMAMLEAMDTELGRLLASMTTAQKDNTIFIFIGDNGTPNQVAQEYSGMQAKGTIYQGGVNVPMVVSGKDVTRINEIENALINTTDLFATIAEIAKTGTSEIHDSKSFAPLLHTANSTHRSYVYTELGKTNGSDEFAIRNASHKYMIFNDGSQGLYDLSGTYIEGDNLLDPQGFPINATDIDVKNELVEALNQLME